MSFTYDPEIESTLSDVRALIPDIVESDMIFDDATLNIYIRLVGGDIWKAAGTALGVAATDHARVESYRKTQGLTVNGNEAAKLMMERAQSYMDYVPPDEEEGLFDIAEYPPSISYLG